MTTTSTLPRAPTPAADNPEGRASRMHDNSTPNDPHECARRIVEALKARGLWPSNGSGVHGGRTVSPPLTCFEGGERCPWSVRRSALRHAPAAGLVDRFGWLRRGPSSASPAAVHGTARDRSLEGPARAVVRSTLVGDRRLPGGVGTRRYGSVLHKARHADRAATRTAAEAAATIAGAMRPDG